MNKIKDARIAAGLSQKKMSQILEIPVRTIQDWEGGKRQLMYNNIAFRKKQPLFSKKFDFFEKF